jgi:CRISPR-associated protein Cas8a1/Csx13
MGRRVANVEQLVMDLFAPGMTALHRAGLAGLWMTLKQFGRNGVHLTGGWWELTPRIVTLHWEVGKTQIFFKSLFERSFRIHRRGVIWFAALGDPADHFQSAVVLNEALLASFLQHGKTRKADPLMKRTGAASVEIDDVPVTVQFRKVSSYVHQTAWEDLVGPDEHLRTTRLAGWHFPGAVVRHVGFSNDTALEEPPERLLPLIYAPVGGIYFQIHKRGDGRRPQYALVLPEILDLERYASARAALVQQGVKDLQAGGSVEAGWRVLATLEAKGLLAGLGAMACRIISFGTVAWSKRQKTRVELFSVNAESVASLRTFRLCLNVFRTRFVRRAEGNGEGFWDVPQMPELIARNLADRCAWYSGFADYVMKESGSRGRDGKRLMLWHLITAPYRTEREGLSKMVNEAGFDDERDRVFVRACHEAWRRRLGQLGERAKRESTSFEDLASREFERLRVGFARCKNAATLREAVTSFWARAGGALPELAARWESVLPLLDEMNWRKAKDLALLALASYQKPQGTDDQTGRERR